MMAPLKAYCATRLLCCAVLGILMYTAYIAVPVFRAPCIQAARDGFERCQ